MNGFKLMADSFKKYLEQKPDDPNRTYLETQIRLNSFLGECSRDDIAELYNTSAFNEITKAYCKKAMQNLGFSEEQISGVISEIRYLHDTLGAGEVLKNKSQQSLDTQGLESSVPQWDSDGDTEIKEKELEPDGLIKPEFEEEFSLSM